MFYGSLTGKTTSLTKAEKNALAKKKKAAATAAEHARLQADKPAFFFSSLLSSAAAVPINTDDGSIPGRGSGNDSLAASLFSVEENRADKLPLSGVPANFAAM